MLTRQKIVTITFALFAVAAFGAGCARSGSKTIPLNALKQPAAAKAPVAPPQIPPEAANIPKPY